MKNYNYREGSIEKYKIGSKAFLNKYLKTNSY